LANVGFLRPIGDDVDDDRMWHSKHMPSLLESAFLVISVGSVSVSVVLGAASLAVLSSGTFVAPPTGTDDYRSVLVFLTFSSTFSNRCVGEYGVGLDFPTQHCSYVPK
jgi:hypothetical protein